MIKQQIARMIQMLVVVLVALFVGAPEASAGTKWDRCVNRMNSRGDKLPDAKGRHCWDTDDDEDEDQPVKLKILDEPSDNLEIETLENDGIMFEELN